MTINKYLFVFIWISIFVQSALCQLCVLPGTCSIQTPTSTPDTTCPNGLVPCTGAVVVQCGVRYVSPISTDDGNTRSGAHPWAAFILNQTAFTGSGALIDQYHVVTAAHKFSGNVATPSNIRVFMGVWDPAILATAQNRTATRIVLHPRFNANTLFHDIAIIRVDTPFLLGVQPTVNTACLPTQFSSYVGQNCIVAGWGQTQFGATSTSPSRPQKQVTLPIVSYTTCRAGLMQPNALSTNVDQYLDRNGEICAGGVANRDTCTDDGGSPLMCSDNRTGRYTIAGLVIWGKGCGQPGVFGVYVSGSFYRNWIDSTIAQLNVG